MQENNGSSQKQGGLSWTTPSAAPSAPAHKAAIAPASATTAPPAPTEQKSATTKYAGMVVIGVIAGTIIAWSYTSWKPSAEVVRDTAGSYADNNDYSAAGERGAETVGDGSDSAFSVSSPQVPGMSVIISKAVVSVPTWVVVYESSSGKPGNALGAALFFPDRPTGTVELLRSTASGRSYLAVKQTDNGDRKFSLKDDQYLSEGGSVQWVTFEVK